MQHCKRPFASVEEMDATMVTNWNSVVSADDNVFYIGDFSFGSPNKIIKIREQLNGRVFFIQGNHDKYMNKEKVRNCFEWVKHYHELTLFDEEEEKDYFLVLCHYAFRTWNASHYGSINIYGHSHDSLPDDPNLLQVDVGVDGWDFTPVSFSQIKEALSKKTFTPIKSRR